MMPIGNGGGTGWFEANPIDAGDYNWPYVAWNRDKYLQVSNSGGPVYYPVIGYGGPIYYTFGCDNIGTVSYATTTDNNADPAALAYTDLATVGFPGVNNWTYIGDFADDLNIWFKLIFKDYYGAWGVSLGVSRTASMAGLMTSTRNLTSNGQPYYCTPEYAIDFTEKVWVQPAQTVADSGGPDMYSCFLKGSPVAMADGTFKPIEDIQVGEYLLGAFGEVNPVIAFNRPVLGPRPMFKINKEHTTTDDHGHILPDGRIGALNLANALEEYSEAGQSRIQKVIVDGHLEDWQVPGIANADLDIMVEMSVGDQVLKITGAETIQQIDQVDLPYDTVLYNFVVGGSHTYYVDGYCVAGWLNGKDFDYRNWRPVGESWTRTEYRRG